MNITLLSKLKNPDFSLKIRADKIKGYCFACGSESNFEYSEIINDDLARQWGVSKKQKHAFSSRESRQCKNCLAIYRNRQFSQVLCENYGYKKNIKCLRDLIEDSNFRNLKIAEINACGPLHQFFAKLPNLAYSEFDSEDPKIRSEDLDHLTYKDKSFDLVVTSDTLEHVPDYMKALSEIHRVLKPSAKHIFTIPVIWKRKTSRRAEFSNMKKIEYMLEPAYHGPVAEANLVWTDFGYDVLSSIEAIGFSTKVLHYNLLNSYDAGCVLVSTKLQ
jgi:SAM-dependent methyltransferase